MLPRCAYDAVAVGTNLSHERAVQRDAFIWKCYVWVCSSSSFEGEMQEVSMNNNKAKEQTLRSATDFRGRTNQRASQLLRTWRFLPQCSKCNNFGSDLGPFDVCDVFFFNIKNYFGFFFCVKQKDRNTQICCAIASVAGKCESHWNCVRNTVL